MPNNFIQGVIFSAEESLKKMFGIDVSHHQGKIDWKVLSTGNTPKIDLAFIKSSTGVGGLDERALFNATEAKKNGIKIGYYHYCSLNDENELDDAKKEAEWFVHVLNTLPQSDLPVALDIEDPDVLPSLDDGEILAWIKTFFATLTSHGIMNHVLYSFTPFLNDHLPKGHGLGNVPLWIAQYRSSLTLPEGWTKSWLWQYTDKGKVNGIQAITDLNKQI